VSSLTRTSTFADSFPIGEDLPLLAKCVVIARSLFFLGMAGLLVACTGSPEEICKEKNEKLNSLIRTANADVLRQRGECEATAYEFQDQAMTESCIETLKVTIKTAQLTHDSVARRREESDMLKCNQLAH
jgi:hypothetical protein